MTLASALTLPELPVLQQAFIDDPQPFMAEARRRHPWLAKCTLGYLIHGHRAIRDILPQDEKLRPVFEGLVKLYGGEATQWGRYQVDQILGRSGEAHLRIRNSVANAFKPRNVLRFRPLIREVVTGLLDAWAPKKQFDFAAFASYFPVTVLCGVLGTSPESIPAIRESLETQSQVLSWDPKLLPALEAAFDVLWTFVDGLVREREDSGVVEEGALLDVAIAAKKAGRISDTELRDLLIVLFVAGYGTSKTLLSVIMHTMIERPAHWRRCAEDYDYCVKVVEEMLRFWSISNASRIAVEDIEYDGVVLPRESVLIFVLSKSGRDPAVFPNPLDFQPGRTHASRHAAFGRGAHICLGQYLARVQIAEGLHVIAQRLKNPTHAGDIVWRSFMAGGGIHSLPIAHDGS
jgi:cytochrome P450